MEKLGKSEAVVVCPNPASEAMDVRFDAYIGNPVTLDFYNTFGQIVLSQKIPTVQNETEHIKIAHLSAGLYQLRVTSPNRNDVVVKVVVNK